MSDLSLHQNLSQQQTLAPQMRKSLEILQAGTMELSQLVRQSLETNPVLEEVTDSATPDTVPPTPDPDDSLEHLNETDDDWRDADLYRLKGVLSLSLDRAAEAEDCFQRALMIARERGAKALELKAALDLARLQVTPLAFHA